jgi:hypothetical protein
VCIAASILGNAGQHYMTSLEVAPPWWVVVLVSAVPPAMLGAVVHLGHLRTAVLPTVGLSTTDRTGGLRTAETPHDLDGVFPVPVPIGGEHGNTPEAQPGQDRVAELIAEGAGRRRLSRELDISEHQARELLARHRVNGSAVAS